MTITQYTVYRRLATSAIILALTVLGFYGLWRLPVDFLPDIEYPEVGIQIWWRGATPDEIEKNIADVVEREMATLDRLEALESSAIDGMYDLRIHFEYGADVDVAYQDVLASMVRARRNLPPDIEEPLIRKADPSQLPVMQLAVSSNQSDLVELREWSERWLNDQLVTVRGVAGTNIIGGQQREIRVLLDPPALEKHGIALNTVLNRIEEENLDQFAGRITGGRKEIMARTTGEFQSLDEIRSVVVARGGQARVTLGDLATVEDGHEEIRVNTRLDGEPCINLSVFKQAGANTVEVADGVRHRLDELRQELPGDVQLSVIQDQAVYVGDAISSVRNAAVQAAVLLVLVVYLFLGSFRQVLVMLLALPLTVLFNFGLMSLAGFSLNIFSLGGLVVALGVVLDNAIVVLESITRRRNAYPEASASEHSIEGTREVGSAIVAATLSFVALFMPFLLVPGLTSLLFRELILVMVGIVAISLILAITLVPMFTAVLFGNTSQKGASRFEAFFMRIAERYARLLETVLRGSPVVLGAFAILLIGAVLLIGRLDGEFLPEMDDGRLMVRVQLPTGASVAETDRLLRRVEERIEDDPMIESCFALSGGRIRGMHVREMANEGELDIQLVSRAQRDMSTRQYVSQLRPAAMQAEIPGSSVMVRPQRVRGIRGRAQSDIEVQVRGADMDTLLRLADEAAAAMNTLENLANVDITMDVSKPEYHIRVDRVRAAELDVSVASVANTLRSLITGSVPTRYLDDGEYYDIRVLVPEGEMTSHLDIANLPLTNAEGNLVRVRDVARVERATGPVEITREDQVKQVDIQADVPAGVSAAQAQADLEAELAHLDLPTGYEISYGGEAALMEDLREAVYAVLAFAVFFAFVVLAVQFNSLKLPALILGSVPFSLVGSILLLYVTSVPFAATVIIGLLVVIAATVNDGVLLMLFAEQIRTTESKTPREAVRDAARIRLRPRLMITMTSMAAFVPLALNWGGGAEMLQPMAVAAIGGLGLEILVALFLMPCLYKVFTKNA